MLERLIQPRIVHGLAQEGPCGISIAPGCKPKIDQLSMLINRPPQVTPLATNQDVGIVTYQISPRQLRWLKLRFAIPGPNFSTRL